MIFNQRRLDNSFSAPMLDTGVSVAPISGFAAQPAPEPFIWGAGGAKLTPEQILAREEMARNQMQSDFSPVQHWTQGLGRVADNVIGALDAKKLDKESAAASADRAAMIAQMLGPDNADLVGAVSSGDKVITALAGDVLERRNPKAASPTDLQRNYEWLAGQGRTDEANALITKATQDNPWITATLPDGNFYSGPARGLASAFGSNEPEGGDRPISPMPGAVGSAAPASAGPGTPHLTVDQMRSIGQGVDFSRWQQQHGTPVLVNSPEEMARVPAGTMVISPDGRRGVKK